MDTRVFNPQSRDKIFVKEVQCELQYCASGSSEIRPLGNPRCSNRRPRPNQRARSDRRCFMGMWRKAPSVENENRKHLLTLSKSLMKKNIKWLSQEDLSISDNGSEKNDDLPSSRFPKCPWQGSIPDDAPATLSQQDGCGVPPLSYLKAEEESQSGLDCISSDSSNPYPYSSSPLSFKYQPSSHHDSSGTLTPGSDVMSSPEASSDKGFSSMVSSPSKSSETVISSPSFTICREASVEGLFIEQTPQNTFCNTEEESVYTNDSHQSPFRRQVFTSLITRQSAMVRKVSQQTCRIMETLRTVAAVSDPDLEAELVEHVQRANSSSDGSTNSIPFDKMVETSCLVQGNETFCQDELYQGVEAENEHGIIISLTSPPEVIEADSSETKEGSVTDSVPRERSCFRFWSMSDSGVEWESDDEGRSLSRGSLTSSEDGMTAITEEQE